MSHPTIRSLLREPLVHFLLFGAALFLFFSWTGGSGGPGSNRIVIGPGQVEHLATGFARTWRRPPTQHELKGLVDDFVREEMATREARSMGLEREDTVIRRRLRQKLEFLVEDAAEAMPPTDAELQAWLDAHPESYRRDPEVAFRQVFLSPDARGDGVEADAKQLLKKLESLGPDADITRLGDSIMLPEEFERAPLTVASRMFGSEFAGRLDEIEPGRWTGPIPSGYGLHLVFVRERIEGRSPQLEEVRDAVTRDLLTSRRKEQLETMYERLLESYDVVIDMPDPEMSSAAGDGSNAAGSP
ncbi:MAG: peptidyl-prolyl cis-trans isomerase [Acidobacteria bacterium]|jgi:GNAT superfamily N-acetyltransferase|nr:peptidyl-prolyl cis-trans isomerase [Acidobacteriota bacterium]